MKSLTAAFVLVCSLVTAIALAAPQAPTTGVTPKAPKASVIIGSTTCFVIRDCAAGQTPQQRADHITDVFNKYLGGNSSTFGVKPTGKNALITMNKEPLIVVTPQDAKTARAKNAARLAAWWKTSLAKAFDETKATK
jgi:hypothetical protein